MTGERIEVKYFGPLAVAGHEFEWVGSVISP